MHPTNRELTGIGKWHLEAAEGWLELGNLLEANEELEQIAPRFRAHPDVLHVRCRVYAAAKKWDLAAEIAEAIAKLVPQDAFGFVQLAYALYELKRIKEAREVLLLIVDKFPDDCLIRYNLACYEGQLGNLVEARDWLLRAFASPGGLELRQSALSDPDLEPLWAEISGI